MKSQKEIFQASEADGWFNRNRTAGERGASADSEIVDVLRRVQLRPGKVLEIGCGNGWRLDRLKAEFHCEYFDIAYPRQPFGEAPSRDADPSRR